MTKGDKYKALADEFRATVSSLPRVLLLEFEKTLQEFLGIKNLRTVQLWTRYGKRETAFISNRTPKEQKDIRLFLAEMITMGKLPINEPVKVKNFPLDMSPGRKASLLDSYVYSDYTREHARGIKFNPSDGSFDYIYAQYPKRVNPSDERLSEEERDDLEREIFG